jgi:putative transposase
MAAVEQLAPTAGTGPACLALGVSRAGWYRRQAPEPEPVQAPTSRREVLRALSDSEREGVLAQLHSVRFVDRSPREVWATLLDEGTYLCSVRTMYRLLSENEEVRERRSQASRTHYSRPELLATAPNQVWSWDITRLKGPVKWSYYHLYTIIDIFSRYVVGWMVAYRESATLAEKFIAYTIKKQGIAEGQLTIHADRGSSMTSRSVALLLADLGVEKTHSRPHVSNDNPYSESQFKTMKYQPDFPDRFGSIEEARSFCRLFFPWYNTEHHHGGLGLLTPETVHYGRAEQVITARQQVLRAAYEAYPERFVKRIPTPPALPQTVWINPPKEAAVLVEPSRDASPSIEKEERAAGGGAASARDLEPTGSHSPGEDRPSDGATAEAARCGRQAGQGIHPSCAAGWQQH